MNIGILGHGPLAGAVARRLIGAYRVHVFPAPLHGELGSPHSVLATTAAELFHSCEVTVICAGSPTEVRELVLGPSGLGDGLSPGKTVIDQTPADPDEARSLAAELQELGVVYIDAPVHSERLATFPDTSAIICGGPADAVRSVRPLLETICPKVVHAGESGSGQAARLVVAVVAACNRLMTYECAATGFRNGLSVADMGTVLTRCSGYSSGTAHVLPAIAAGDRPADVSLASVVSDLVLASRLAMRVGAPMIIGNVVRSLLQAESNHLGASAQLDDTHGLFARAAGSAGLAS